MAREPRLAEGARGVAERMSLTRDRAVYLPRVEIYDRQGRDAGVRADRVLITVMVTVPTYRTRAVNT